MQVGSHCATSLVKDHGGHESTNCVDECGCGTIKWKKSATWK